MTLEAFLDLWTRKNLALILCKSSDYDDMFDIVDELNEEDQTLDVITEYMICTILPCYSTYRESYYIKEKWMNAEVTNFFIGTTYMIVWVEPEVKKD